MKFLGFIVLFSYLGIIPTSEQFSLTVKVTGIGNQKGMIELAVYNDPGKFAQVGKTFRIARIKPTGSELTHKFTNLPPNDYAVCIYHDENGNKMCDKNFVGIPTEAYAFSNNVRPRFSIPDFKDCSTELNKDKLFIIKMVY
jgi:uncharacterized protein (DUF2141 family)